MEKPSSASQAPHSLRADLYRLYVSHLLTRWKSQMWEFSIALLLMDIYPDSLLLAAVYGLCSTSSVVLLGPVIGHFVDVTRRITIVRIAVALQNSAVLACMIMCLLVLNASLSSLVFWALVALIIATGVLQDLGALMSTIAVEKDWVVVITEGDSALLARTNATLRRIDLTCDICAPLLVGLVMSFASISVGTALVGAWNLASIPLEYFLLLRVFKTYPALRAARNSEDEETAHQGTLRRIATQFVVLATGWRVYVQQRIALAGLALALLFCTVLSFHTIMTAYVFYRGMGEWVVSLARGGGAVAGVLGTVVFVGLQNKVGLVRAGNVANVLQLVCLGAPLASLFYGDPGSGDCSDLPAGPAQDDCLDKRNLELLLLCGGVILSRAGLWMFDLCVGQMLQEHVQPEAALGTVNGVQQALQSFLEMMAYVLSIVFSEPSDWPVLVLISFGCVTISFLLYLTFSFTHPNLERDKAGSEKVPLLHDSDGAPQRKHYGDDKQHTAELRI